MRSFATRPPHYVLTLQLVDDQDTSDAELASYLGRFTQTARDYRKQAGAEVEWDMRIEFRHGRPHVHLTVITSLKLSMIGELARRWWTRACQDRETVVGYCKPAYSPEAWARYATKHLKDRSKVELPPEHWDGRRCRLIRQSSNFLSKPKPVLWREHIAESFPASANYQYT